MVIKIRPKLGLQAPTLAAPLKVWRGVEEEQ